jgi:hypothetical protein
VLPVPLLKLHLVLVFSGDSWLTPTQALPLQTMGQEKGPGPGVGMHMEMHFTRKRERVRLVKELSDRG